MSKSRSRNGRAIPDGATGRSTPYFGRATPDGYRDRDLQGDSPKHRGEAADELFLMTNLFPASTGLPMVIWVEPSYGVGHDIRIKVMQHHGTRMDPDDLAVVAARPQPHLIAGRLSAADLRAVSQWIVLNEPAIIEHWNGLTDGSQLSRQLRPLAPPIPP